MGNYQSGGRTRNIINVANVGGAGTFAYVFTTSSATAPSLATMGTQITGLKKTYIL